MTRTKWHTAYLAASVFYLAAGTSWATDLEVSWDEELAFENDRANYERMLNRIVQLAFKEVTQGLGITPDASLKIRVHTPANYRKSFGSRAAIRRGAHYFRGAVHVNGGKRMNDRFAGMIVHEIVHAVVDHKGTGHFLPQWLNEGVAERFRWRHLGLRDLAPNQLREIIQARKLGKLTPLPARGGMTPYRYLQAYAVVLFIEKEHGQDELCKLLKTTIEGRSFSRALKKVLGTEIKFLEREFEAWVKGLD